MKDDIILKLIPEKLKPYLYDGLYMSIGDIIYKATAKTNGEKRQDGSRIYYLDFIEVTKDLTNKVKSSKSVLDIYRKFNCDYEYPVPCNLPSEYEFVIDGIIWNTYNYPHFNPTDRIKDDLDLEEFCPNTLQLFRHIYGDQIQMGIDYMVVEFMFPAHPLPMQVLYSRENNTGKTTLIEFKKEVYGKNATIITSDVFEDKFNSPIANKNYVGIDEGKMKDERSMEKIKNLITSSMIQHRAMRKSAEEKPNFAKWAIATNKDNFAKLDMEDSRFWVLKIPKISSGYDPHFKELLKKEIPDWIGFLCRRWINRFNGKGMFKMETPEPLSRLWLEEKQYSTLELAKIKRSSLSLNAKDILEGIKDWFEKKNNNLEKNDTGVVYFYATATDIKENLFRQDHKLSPSIIKYVLEVDLRIQVEKNEVGRVKKIAYVDYLGEINGYYQTVRRTNVYLIEYRKILDIMFGEGNYDLPEDAERKQQYKESEQLKIGL